jgi:hypothetical protein
MNTRSRVAAQSGSTVWVWDSTWLPAVVVDYGVDLVRVRLAHGVTFSVDVDKLVVRDSAGGGKDAPHECWRGERVIYKQLKGGVDVAQCEGKRALTRRNRAITGK